MPTSRYPDWESFTFPAVSPEPGSGSGSGNGNGNGGSDRPVAFCADLSRASVLGAYRKGIVPLPASGDYFATLNEFRYSSEVAAGTIAIVGDEGGDPYSVAWWS